MTDKPQLTIQPIEGEEDFTLPSITEVGSILFEYTGTGCGTYAFDVEVHANSGGTFWIGEGVGWDYWFDQHLESGDLPTPGFYVVENVRGSWTRGDGWTTDDDEAWEFDSVRPATASEIAEKAVP